MTFKINPEKFTIAEESIGDTFVGLEELCSQSTKPISGSINIETSSYVPNIFIQNFEDFEKSHTFKVGDKVIMDSEKIIYTVSRTATDFFTGPTIGLNRPNYIDFLQSTVFYFYPEHLRLADDLAKLLYG